MYQPAAFCEDRVDALHGLIRARPLGLLISHGEAGLMADPLPFLLVTTPAPGVLRGHLARANPHVAQLAAGLATGLDVLVVFQGPDHYVSPSWYPSKAEHGKVVPTWNYVQVQVAGRARLIDDAAWLHALVSALTDAHEQGRPAPWSVGDAPEAFIDRQIKAIVGVEIAITAIAGKWKVSQNRPPADRAGVADGLAADAQGAAADRADAARAMAALVRERSG